MRAKAEYGTLTLMKGDEVVERPQRHPNLLLFRSRRKHQLIICVFLRIDARLAGSLRGYVNILLVGIGQGCLIDEFRVSTFSDSCANQESSKVDRSIVLPVQIGFSNTCPRTSEEQIAFLQ